VQGFLAEDDVGEDWLDDDMACITRPNKKRRLAGPIEKHRYIGTKIRTPVYGKERALIFNITTI
jgi:hypothetical protein